jgi:hypothetical protein
VLYVDLIEDKPLSLEEYKILHPSDASAANYEAAYRSYRENFQPHRWHAKDPGNHEILAQGESYFNATDNEATVRRLFDQNTIVYLRKPEHGNEMIRDAYPKQLGDITLIGPDCYAQADGTVLNWQGRNYIPQPEPTE